jgi:hypothetical protein
MMNALAFLVFAVSVVSTSSAAHSSEEFEGKGVDGQPGAESSCFSFISSLHSSLAGKPHQKNLSACPTSVVCVPVYGE